MYVHESSWILAGICDTLLPMMNALRMVWIISRHYSDDTKMGNLFCQIANTIGNRVEEHIVVPKVFSMPAGDALKLINTATCVLTDWRETYMKVRERIESSGQHARWEFPKSMLFERTGHIGTILKDLKFMVDTVDDFFKFLGPELKAVTGDAEARTCW
jgi:dynein heavy chain, axonemal